MKSKLLLSLGLVTILGMAQASEAPPEVRNIMEMFARLSPRDQLLVRTGILDQERGSFVSVNSPRMTGSSDAAKDPEWLIEFGVRKFEDIKDLRIDMTYGSTSPGLNEIMDKRVQVLRAILDGRTPNLRLMQISFDKSVNSEEFEKELINVFRSGKLLNLQELQIYTDGLSDERIARLKEVVFNSRMPELRILDLDPANFDFAAEVASRKFENYPKLSEVRFRESEAGEFEPIRLELAQGKGIALIGWSHPPYSGSNQFNDRLRQLAKDWCQRNGQED